MRKMWKKNKMVVLVYMSSEAVKKIGMEIEESITEKYRIWYAKTVEKRILDFISSHGYIIKTTPERTYEEGHFYSIYSPPTGKSELRNFADDLYRDTTDIKYIEVIRQNEHEYDLRSNFKTILRLRALREDIFKELPREGDRVSDNILKLNIYKLYCDPTNSMSKWEKAYEFEEEFLNNGNRNGNRNSVFGESTNKKILSELYEKYIDINTDIVLAGDAVSNILLKTAKVDKTIKVSGFTVLSHDVDKEISKIKDLFKDRTILKREIGKLHFFKARFNIFVDRVKVLTIYDISDRCYPVSEMNIKIASYPLLIKFYLIDYLNERSKDKQKDIISKVDLLNDTRKSYYEATANGPFSDSLFQMFKTSCYGIERSDKLKNLIKGTKQEYRRTVYKPELSKKIQKSEDNSRNEMEIEDNSGNRLEIEEETGNRSENIENRTGNSGNRSEIEGNSGDEIEMEGNSGNEMEMEGSLKNI